MKYEATVESVTKHRVPKWYEDAKFGIFIHWGLFSVPGWAYSEEGKSIRDIHGETDEYEGQKFNPYAEWYQNSLRIEGSPTQDYHKEHYGADFAYEDFQKEFEQESSKMDPKVWADLFAKSGAQYVVMVTKHHDGYCLWPSECENPERAGYFSKRDLVGEVTEAVREKGLKMGLYYSGIFDWSFKKQPMNSEVKWLDHYLPTDEYARYAFAQTMELIHTYKPSVLWNDMGYPGQCDLDLLLSEYYNEVEEGVTNERWVQRRLPEGMTIEEYAAELSRKGEVTRLDDGIHGDFLDPEYIYFDRIPDKKWEQTRGVGMSFGYNRNENAENFLKGKDMIYMLADTVAMNGNLLMNVGPMADGTIQEQQIRPLLETGEWLQTNGEAIYGTTCWTSPRAMTTEDKEVRFTRKGEDVFAIILDDRPGETVTIQGLEIPHTCEVSILGTDGVVTAAGTDKGTQIILPEKICSPAYVVRFSSLAK